MKRRSTKKQIHRLETRMLAALRKYVRAGPSVHQDVIFGYENIMDRSVYHILRLHLRLDPSWPHRGRWLDHFEDFRWRKGARALGCRGRLWWAHYEHVGGGHVVEDFVGYVGISRRHGLTYLLKMGAEGKQRCYSNCGGRLSYKRCRC